MEIKVKDFLELLQKCDLESNIFFKMSSGCCGDWEDMESEDFDHVEGRSPMGKNPDGTTIWENYSFPSVTLHPVPGYGSCRQAGHTKREHKLWWMKKNGSYRPTVKINDIDLEQALLWACSNASFGTPNWIEHFKRAIGMIS